MDTTSYSTASALSMQTGTVKAVVLIENVLATFQLEEILWELRDHSAGLNCGVSTVLLCDSWTD